MAATRPPLRVGLVGAGPWAQRAHGPALAGSAITELVGVWTRRPEAAADLAQRLGTAAYAEFDELVDSSEAIAFAVPPAIQVDLACQAAEAGRALLLEKPLAADLAGAERLAGTVARTGVTTQLVLTLRYSSVVRRFLREARALGPVGGNATWVAAATGEDPRSSWRVAGGALLDIGPHVIDLLDAALGPIRAVRAHSAAGWTGLLLEHEGSVVSEASISVPVPGARPELRACAYGSYGSAHVELGDLGDDVWDTVLQEFVTAVRGEGAQPLDAQHGLRLQRLIASASAQLEPPSSETEQEPRADLIDRHVR